MCFSACLPASLSICPLLVYRAWWTVVWAVRSIATRTPSLNRHQHCMHCTWMCLLKLRLGECKIACMHKQHTHVQQRVQCHCYCSPAFVAVHQKPFIPHWMRDSFPAGSSISRDLGHSRPSSPWNPLEHHPNTLQHDASCCVLYKVQPKNKSTSCLLYLTFHFVSIQNIANILTFAVYSNNLISF